MEKVLICGANGQLGCAIKLLSDSFNMKFIYADLPEIDITDMKSVEKFVETGVTTIVNCAAYTAVDKAESEELLAHKINVDGVAILSLVAKRHNIKLVHISTDYVFDGNKTDPYLECDTPSPQGVYGKTKLDGERAMKESGCRGVIIRTAWLYSEFGNNFCKTMLRLGAQRESLGVVDDQRGTPTYAVDLARAILEIIPKIDNEHGEIFHYSNQGAITWADFAQKIMEIAGLSCRIERITTEDYPTPAPRPKCSILSKDKIVARFGVEVPQWESSLKYCIEKLV